MRPQGTALIKLGAVANFTEMLQAFFRQPGVK